MTRESVDLDVLSIPAVMNRKYAPDNEPFVPFAADKDTNVPGFLPIGHQQIVRQTSSTHGRDGYITTDPDTISQFQERLNRKLVSAVGEFSFYAETVCDEADTLLIAYGITARSALIAAEELNRQGRYVSLLILKTLWPVPEKLICEKARDVRRVVVVEMNMGQYVREIRRLLPHKRIDFWGQMNGSLISPNQIKEVVADDQPVE